MSHDKSTGRSGRNYTNISSDDMWNFVYSSNRWFRRRESIESDAYIFDILYSKEDTNIDAPVAIRWHTTVRNDTDKAFGRGERAMKVGIIHHQLNELIYGYESVYRVESWRDNLEETIRNIEDRLSDLPTCPLCGSALIILKNDSDEISVCSRFYANGACSHYQ